MVSTCVASRPAAMAVISLAFGQYILEPLFMPCDIPPLAVKLATAIGLSMFLHSPVSKATFANQKRCRCKALKWSPPQAAISTSIIAPILIIT